MQFQSQPPIPPPSNPRELAPLQYSLKPLMIPTLQVSLARSSRWPSLVVCLLPLPCLSIVMLLFPNELLTTYWRYPSQNECCSNTTPRDLPYSILALRLVELKRGIYWQHCRSAPGPYIQVSILGMGQRLLLLVHVMDGILSLFERTGEPWLWVSPLLLLFSSLFFR